MNSSTVKQIPVILYGVGGVGRALLRQMLKGYDVIAQRNNIEFHIVALADSGNWLSDLDGLSEEQIRGVLEVKEKGGQWGDERPSNLEILNLLQAVGLPEALVVDVTAQNGMEPVLDQALAYG
jgi:homoserine dehydrogenase